MRCGIAVQMLKYCVPPLSPNSYGAIVASEDEQDPVNLDLKIYSSLNIAECKKSNSSLDLPPSTPTHHSPYQINDFFLATEDPSKPCQNISQCHDLNASPCVCSCCLTGIYHRVSMVDHLIPELKLSDAQSMSSLLIPQLGIVQIISNGDDEKDNIWSRYKTEGQKIMIGANFPQIHGSDSLLHIFCLDTSFEDCYPLVNQRLNHNPDICMSKNSFSSCDDHDYSREGFCKHLDGDNAIYHDKVCDLKIDLANDSVKLVPQIGTPPLMFKSSEPSSMPHHFYNNLSNLQPIKSSKVILDPLPSSIPHQVETINAIIKDTIPSQVKYSHNLVPSYRYPKSSKSSPRLTLMEDTYKFSRPPTCFSLNQISTTLSGINILVGYENGMILYHNMAKGEQKKFNESNRIAKGPVTRVDWIPNSTHCFLTSFSDGCIYIFDIELESSINFVLSTDINKVWPKMSLFPACHNGVDYTMSTASGLNVDHDSSGQHDLPNHLVWHNVSSNSFSDKPTLRSIDAIVTNPITIWSIFPGSVIRDFAYSKSSRYLAVVSNIGYLHVYDYEREELLFCSSSYFGGFTTVSWSPDDLFVATGSEDDLISLWSLSERKIATRCYGHASWPSRIQFDPWRYLSGQYYRIASTGQDGRLAFWDFAIDMLQPPHGHILHQWDSCLDGYSRNKIKYQEPDLNRDDINGSNHWSNSLENTTSKLSTMPLLSNLGLFSGYHHFDPSKPREGESIQHRYSQSPSILKPISIQKISSFPCSDLIFMSRNMLIAAGWGNQLLFFLFKSNGNSNKA